MELHAGRVEAYSAGPGQGSEFVVRLPALADARRPVPPLTNGKHPAVHRTAPALPPSCAR